MALTVQKRVFLGSFIFLSRSLFSCLATSAEGLTIDRRLKGVVPSPWCWTPLRQRAALSTWRYSCERATRPSRVTKLRLLAFLPLFHPPLNSPAALFLYGYMLPVVSTFHPLIRKNKKCLFFLLALCTRFSPLMLFSTRCSFVLTHLNIINLYLYLHCYCHLFPLNCQKKNF